MHLPKYIGHFARNFFIFFIFFASFKLLGQTHISAQTFVLGAFAVSFVYAPVYFLNDYFDRKEDEKYKKANLFSVFKNKYTYIFLSVSVGAVGLVLTYLVNKSALMLVPFLYLLNFFYSAPPLRLRDKRGVREVVIFMLYAFKALFVYRLLYQPIDQLAIYLLLLHSCIGSFGIGLYKRYRGESKTLEFFFGSLLIVILSVVLFSYPTLALLYLPIIPAAGFIYVYYKKKQFPLFAFEFGFFVYVLAVYLYRFAV